MQPQKILVVGGGGREHAICWKLAQSPLCQSIFCAPGNGGTATTSKTQNVAINVDDIPALAAFCKANAVDFAVIGPDNPPAEGIVDSFDAEGIKTLGPTKAAA